LTKTWLPSLLLSYLGLGGPGIVSKPSVSRHFLTDSVVIELGVHHCMCMGLCLCALKRAIGFSVRVEINKESIDLR